MGNKYEDFYMRIEVFLHKNLKERIYCLKSQVVCNLAFKEVFDMGLKKVYLVNHMFAYHMFASMNRGLTMLAIYIIDSYVFCFRAFTNCCSSIANFLSII